MTFTPPGISWYWRFLTAFIISSTLIAIIWVFSQFREAPQFSVIFNFLLILMAYATLEIVREFQKRFYNNTLFKGKYLNRIIVFLGSIVAGTLVYTVLFYFFKWLDYYVNGSEPPFLQHMIAAALIGVVMSIIFGLIEFSINWKSEYYKAHLQNEQFKKEIVKTNLKILKNQLDPHFMFNNFNTLYYLIDEDTKMAKHFLKNVSNVYRYILQNNEKQLVPAMEEYTISKQYLAVMQQRYGAQLTIEDQIEAAHLEHKMIPPLVLQQLIENVIKHNRIDTAFPLQLHLFTNEGQLTIENSYNPKKVKNSNGSGLKNIKERYQFLTDQKIVSIQNAEKFSVAIPLITDALGN